MYTNNSWNLTTFTYKYVLNKVYSRLLGWMPQTLSLVGRITVVKSVRFSIPTYTMQTIGLPRVICDSIDKGNRNFLWEDMESKKKFI